MHVKAGAEWTALHEQASLDIDRVRDSRRRHPYGPGLSRSRFLAQQLAIVVIARFEQARATFRQPSIAYATVERVTVAVYSPSALFL